MGVKVSGIARISEAPFDHGRVGTRCGRRVRRRGAAKEGGTLRDVHEGVERKIPRDVPDVLDQVFALGLRRLTQNVERALAPIRVQLRASAALRGEVLKQHEQCWYRR